MPSRGPKGRERGRPPESDTPMFYAIACELADDQPLPSKKWKITGAVKKVVQQVIAPSPTRLEVTVRRVRRKFIQQNLARWLPPIAKKYGRVDEYDPDDPRFADEPLATPEPNERGRVAVFSGAGDAASARAKGRDPRVPGLVRYGPEWLASGARTRRRCMDN
jgi:hypothetical protein